MLELRGLAVSYRIGRRAQGVLRGVSLAVGPGEAYGLVGESGCGKSTAALAAMRALPANGAVTAGAVWVDGQDLAGLTGAALRQMRARRVSMVYQDPARALNPAMTVGRQVAEAFEVAGAEAPTARRAALDALGSVRIAGAAGVMALYPHQLSGGMQQRIVIAMALAKDPALLVLDEPTTGLDATVAADILDLLAERQRVSGTALLLISHDIGVVARLCGRVGVLYAGLLVEEGPLAAVLARPVHPYTTRLLGCLPAGRRKAEGKLATIPGTPPAPGEASAGCVFAPRCALADETCRRAAPPLVQSQGQLAFCHHPGADHAPPPADAERQVYAGSPVLQGPLLQGPVLQGPVLQAEGLAKRYAGGGVDHVALTLHAGQTVALVGESGSGKTTLARLLLGLAAPDAGEVRLNGKPLAALARSRTRAERQALQAVFQNPDGALNPAYRVGTQIGRPLRHAGRAARVAEIASAVRLTPANLAMRPRQLSGGLKQRVAIARAFAAAPQVVVCDEPTSSLDVSVQAAILNLLVALQAQTGAAILFISHDLGVVRYLADALVVLYRGQVVESGPSEAVFAGPNHPYTEMLLAALPAAAAHPRSAAGPARSGGCVFAGRCPRRLGPVCEAQPPALAEQDGHAIRCHIGREALPRRPPGLGPPEAL